MFWAGKMCDFCSLFTSSPCWLNCVRKIARAQKVVESQLARRNSDATHFQLSASFSQRILASLTNIREPNFLNIGVYTQKKTHTLGQNYLMQMVKALTPGFSEFCRPNLKSFDYKMDKEKNKRT